MKEQRLDYFERVVHNYTHEYRDRNIRQQNIERDFVLKRARTDGDELKRNISEVSLDILPRLNPPCYFLSPIHLCGLLWLHAVIAACREKSYR